MTATKTSALPTNVALLYVATLPTSGLTAPTVDSNGNITNVGAVITALESAVTGGTGWSRLASLQNVKISTDYTKNKKDIITDDNQLIYLSTIYESMVEAIWFETQDPLCAQILSGVTPTVTGTDPAKVYKSGFQAIPRNLPRLVVKIVTVANSAGKIDTDYLVDASPDGAVLNSFLKQDGTFEGSPIKFLSNRGGQTLRDRQTYTGA